ncbi:hypothetical protein O181_007854 [Austropuccinia psidii MF-1]|uniref:Uncharacterized protein n=1 Tax=Austropuccinia psidii MF-1 TaxID=1389203 RepID=A0A9Q3BMT6_9BASI|nr:hypothetical protein [Austropuccinia psidii MF-1]
MQVQHSPPAKNTRSQRHQAVLTRTERAPLDHTPSVHQLSANLERQPPMEGAAPSRRGVVKSGTSRSLSGLLDTRYHGRQKEKGSHEEKKPPISGSNSSKPPQSSLSKKPYHRKNKKGKNFRVSKDKPHAALLTKDSKLIGPEKERRIKEGLCNYCGGKHQFETCFKRPENRQGSSRGFRSKKGNA